MKKLPILMIVLFLLVLLISGCATLFSVTTPAGCSNDPACLNCVNQPTQCRTNSNLQYEVGYSWSNGVCGLDNYQYCANGCDTSTGKCAGSLTTTCIDNDNTVYYGDNTIYTKSSVTFAGTNYDDYCVNSNTLGESVCDSSSGSLSVATQTVTCTNGCSNDVCTSIMTGQTCMQQSGFLRVSNQCESNENQVSYNNPQVGTICCVPTQQEVSCSGNGGLLSGVSLCSNLDTSTKKYTEVNYSPLQIGYKCCKEATIGSCTDSDGGIVINNKGTASLGSNQYPDSCSGTILTEYYCESNLIKSQTKNCADFLSNVCENGACIVKAVCGNNICDEGETKTSCLQDCEKCGNDVINSGEECDGTNLNSKICTSFSGYTSGTLKCGGSCQYNFDACVGSSGSNSVTLTEYYSIPTEKLIKQNAICSDTSQCKPKVGYKVECDLSKSGDIYNYFYAKCDENVGVVNEIIRGAFFIFGNIFGDKTDFCVGFAGYKSNFDKLGMCVAKSESTMGMVWDGTLNIIGGFGLPTHYVLLTTIGILILLGSFIFQQISK